MYKIPTSESEHQKSRGLLQEIKVPTWMWENINIDFLVGFPRTQKQFDSIWVIIDRLTKCTHFIPVKSTYSAEDYARIFIGEILCHMVFRYPLYWIGVHDSHLGFGGHSKKS